VYPPTSSTPPQGVPMGAQEAAKEAAARAALALVQPGMAVGLGSGSTAERFVRLFAQAWSQGLRLRRLVATSRHVAALAQRLGLPVEVEPEEVEPLDVDVDGADAFDDQGRLLKGYGGALLREKLVARASRRFLAVVDWTKARAQLGGDPIPVVVVPFAWQDTARYLAQRGLGEPHLRRAAQGQPFHTDQGNLILDVMPSALSEDLPAWAREVKGIPGVVEHGLFLDLPWVTLLVGQPDGTAQTRHGGTRLPSGEAS
jgi:ribose 5-phosphate isomerase A